MPGGAPRRGFALIACLGALAGAALAPSGALAVPLSFSVEPPNYVPPGSATGVSVLTGEFNHDGKPDVAFANSYTYNEIRDNCPIGGCVSVLLGNGDGTFISSAIPGFETLFPWDPANYPSGGIVNDGSAALAQGDLNGDGNTDLVVANYRHIGEVPDEPCAEEGCVTVLYGKPNGEFEEPVFTPSEGLAGHPEAVAVGNFTGSGRMDIAVATVQLVEGQGWQARLYLLVNEGNDAQGRAVFKVSPPTTLAGEVTAVTGMTVANMAGHGASDLVLATTPAGNSESGECGVAHCVQVLLDDGTGGFGVPLVKPVDGEGQIAAADLRGKGFDDIVLPGGGAEPDGFWVLLNKGNGELEDPRETTYAGSEYPSGVAVADFNGDGKLDVAVGDRRGSFTALFAGDGTGSFTYEGLVGDPEELQSGTEVLASADFNGDCRPDLVETGYPLPQETASGTAPRSASGYPGGAVIMMNETGLGTSACKSVTPPPVTTTTTTTTTTAASPGTSTPTTPQPRLEVKGVRVVRRVVHATISARGLPAACTRSGFRLHFHVALDPASPGAGTGHGASAVQVHSVVVLDGRQIASSSQRSFAVTLSRSQFGVGKNTLKVIVTTSGSGVTSARRVQTLHFSRCLPEAAFTG